MNDENNTTTSTGTGKKSGLCKASLFFGLLSGVFFFFLVSRGAPIAGWLGILAGVIAVVTGIVGFFKTKKQPELYEGRALAIVGLILGLVSSAWLTIGAISYQHQGQQSADAYFCSMNMRVIWTAAKTYADSHQGQFPPDFTSFSKEMATANWNDFTADSQVLTRTREIHQNKDGGYVFLAANQKNLDSATQAIVYCPLHHQVLMGDGILHETDKDGHVLQ